MNITDLLDENEIPYKQVGEDSHARLGWLQVACPFCGEGSNKYHLGINIEHHYANCWKCGSHGLIGALALLTGLPTFDIQKTLSSFLCGKAPERIQHRGSLKIPVGLEPLSPVHRAYLSRRGLDAKLTASQWDLSGIRIHARLPWRIFIPIIHHDKVVSWTTRSIGNNPRRRYISARPEEEIIPHKQLLYGEDYARHSVVVVEGPADAWRIGPGAVATLGLSYTQRQVRAIAKYPLRGICFDREPDARRRGERLCEELSAYPGTTHLIELDSDDPGEATDAEICRIRTEFFGDLGKIAS